MAATVDPPPDLFLTLPVGVVIHALDGRITAANPAALRILGLSLEQLRGVTSADPAWRVIREDGSAFPAAEHPAMRCLGTGRAVDGVIMGVSHADGRHDLWLSVSAVPLLQDGHLSGAYAVFEDISARMRAERARRDSEARLHLAQRYARLGVWEWDAVTDRATWSAEVEAMYGLAPGSFEGTQAAWLARVHELDQARVLRELARYAGIADPFDIEFRIQHPRLGARWLASRGQSEFGADGRLRRIVGVNFDITERKETELALEAAREQLDLALSGADLGTYDTDMGSGRVRVNERYLAILGEAPGADYSLADWLARMHPEDQPRISQFSQRPADALLAGVDLEYRLRHRDGHWVWVHDRGRAYGTDARGRPLRAAGTLQDISDRKRAEQALRDSEARYRSLVDAAPYALVVIRDELVVLANPACLALLGAERPEQVLGRPGLSFIHPDSLERVQQRGHRALVLGQVNAAEELKFLRLDGEVIEVEAVSAPFDYLGARAVHVMFRDIGERKARETETAALRSELQQLLEWQVASQTVAGIAHELNQPLNAITTYGEAVQQLLAGIEPAPERLRRAVTGMARQAQRAGNVLRQLMGFLRRGDARTESFDLHDLARETAHQVGGRGETPRPVRVTCAPGLSSVQANRLQVERVLLNLLRNGVEAMRQAGTPATEWGLTLALSVEGNQAQVRVSDTGPGPSDIAGLFTPFRTTKPQGMGLGLSISRALVEAQGGRLWFEPTRAGGACFIFTLPLST